MDAYGHINNVQVLRILEEARIHAFGSPGGTGGFGERPPVQLFSAVNTGVQTLVVEHRVKYVAPLDYRNIPLNIEVWISEIKPASFTMAYLVRDPMTDTVCVKAETVLAFIDVESGRPLRITQEQRHAVEPFLGEPVFS